MRGPFRRLAARVPKSFSARLCVALFVALGFWIAYAQLRIAPPGRLTLRKVTDDLYDIEGEGGNVAVYVTAEGVVLVDDKYERDFGGIMARLHTITAQPVKYVFNTHCHGDHMLGNARFIRSARIVSTANARANVLRDPVDRPGGTAAAVYDWGKRLASVLLPSQFSPLRGRRIPAQVVFTSEYRIAPGGKEVRALYIGRGHTDGDAVVYFPAARTIHMGDLMANNAPLVDYTAGGSLAEWVNTLDRALRLDFDIVIPGHGPVTNKDGLRAYRDTAARLRDEMSGWIRAGKSRKEIRRALTAEFGWAPDSFFMELNLPGMMREFGSSDCREKNAGP